MGFERFFVSDQVFAVLNLLGAVGVDPALVSLQDLAAVAGMLNFLLFPFFELGRVQCRKVACFHITFSFSARMPPQTAAPSRSPISPMTGCPGRSGALDAPFPPVPLAA